MYATATLRGLEPDQLDDLARAHEEQAAVLRAAASRRREELGIQANTKAHFEAMDRLPAQVEHFEKTQFMSRADAVNVVGQLSGVHPGTIARKMHRAEKQAKADQKAARGRMIVGLAADGQSNAEIGRRTGLHPDTVARIIQRTINRDRVFSRIRRGRLAAE